MTFHFPPRQMRAAAAAYYLGLSKSTFIDRVAAGEYPQGKWDGGAKVWLRDDLDGIIDRRFNVVRAVAAAAAAADPFAARYARVR